MIIILCLHSFFIVWSHKIFIKYLIIYSLNALFLWCLWYKYFIFFILSHCSWKFLFFKFFIQNKIIVKYQLLLIFNLITLIGKSIDMLAISKWICFFKNVMDLINAFIQNFTNMLYEISNSQKMSELDFNIQSLQQKHYILNI